MSPPHRSPSSLPSIIASIPSLTTLLKTLAHHPTVSQYLRFVATTLGRDKVLRLLQYLARFFSWYFLRKGYSAEVIAPWDAMKKTFATVRKAMRLGKNVEHIRAASQALELKSDPISSYLVAGRQLGYFLYLTCDNLVFLSTTDIYRFKSTARLQRQAQQFWLMGILFSIANGVYKLRMLAKKGKDVKKTEAEGRLKGEKIVRDRRAVKMQLVSDVADAVIPSAGLGWLKVDEGIVGIAGTVSSWIALKQAWMKAKA